MVNLKQSYQRFLLMKHSNSNNPPFVSVIMPICNEASYISSCLDSVLDQDYSLDNYEVLISDGMSTDGTREIVQKYQQEYRNVQLVDNPGKIVPSGINAALTFVKGEIIVRIDGHTRIATNYITECVETLQRTNADNVGGRMNAVGTTTFGKAVALATSSPFGVGGAASITLKRKNG